MKVQTLGEDIFSAVTAGVGCLALAGVVVVQVLVLSREPWSWAYMMIYDAGLLLSYLGSTLYHSLARTRAAKVFRVIDHCAIYALIGGTYAPIVPRVAGGVKAVVILGAVWACAVAGMALSAVFHTPGRLGKALELTAYIAMGWVAALFLVPDFLAHNQAEALGWLLAGGVAYTAGTGLYGWHRLKFNHAYWHFAVLAGSGLQFGAIALLW